jgi:hypothetical protein
LIWRQSWFAWFADRPVTIAISFSLEVRPTPRSVRISVNVAFFPGVASQFSNPREDDRQCPISQKFSQD